MMGTPPSGNYPCLLNNTRFLQGLGFDHDHQEELLQLAMLERKRKRMEANRESARRSRKRKQKYVDDMVAQVVELRKQNSELVAGINMATQMYRNVETENSILRTQIAELTQTLRSLNQIMDLVNSTRTTTRNGPIISNEALNFAVNSADMFLSHNQPIMACAANLFQW